MINGSTYGRNIRDLGGWACDGGTVKYGMLYRGADVFPTDLYIRPILVGECGVRMELDLRGKEEEPIRDTSALGNIRYCCPETFVWYSLTNTTAWKEILKCIFDSILTTTPVYFHCSAGMDRTGTVACIVEALLGMNQNDIDKDYELSSFAGTAYLKKRSDANWVQLIDQINNLSGATFNDKVINWVISLGFTIDVLNSFRTAMIDGTPTPITPSTYTNLADPTSPDWKTDYRISSSAIVPQQGKTVSNPITCKIGDVVRVKGVNFVANEDRYQLHGHNSAGTEWNQRAYVSVLPDAALDYTFENNIHTFTVKYNILAGDGTICFAFTTPTNVNDIIITLNENIPA